MSYQMKESFIDYSQINAFTHHFYQGTSFSSGVKPALTLGHGLPHGVKYELNLGEGFPHRAKVCQNPGEGFAYPAKVQTDFRARFHPLGYGLPGISGKVLQPLHSYVQNLGKVLPPLQNFNPDPGHTFATPAKVSTESGADNFDFCLTFSESRAYNTDLEMTKNLTIYKN